MKRNQEIIIRLIFVSYRLNLKIQKGKNMATESESNFITDNELENVVGGAGQHRTPDPVPKNLIPRELGPFQYVCRACYPLADNAKSMVYDTQFDQSVWGWEYVGPCFRCTRCGRIYVKPASKGGEWFFMKL